MSRLRIRIFNYYFLIYILREFSEKISNQNKLLSSLVVSCVSGDWVQPAFDEVLSQVGQKNQNWGHPVGKIAALYNLCPELNIPDGAESIVCDQG